MHDSLITIKTVHSHKTILPSQATGGVVIYKTESLKDF